MNKKIAFQISLGGVCLALTMVFLLGASLLPGMKLTFYAIASLFVAIMVIETGIKGGLVLYLAAILLTLLLVPNKLAILPYACLFGNYGIVKYYIEKCKVALLQLALKACFFGAVLAVALFLFQQILVASLTLPDIPKPLVLVAGLLFLFLYDAIYTFFINVYLRNIRPKIIRTR